MAAAPRPHLLRGQKTLLPDYHTHTARCGHAVGRASDYVAEARRKGLPGLGIADHLPILPDPDPQLSMSVNELPEYVEEVLEEKRRHPGYVLLGIEADYRPDTVDQVAELLRAHPFDYVIGSVHFLGDWGFDDPRHADGFERRDVDEVYRAYFDLMGRAAESGLFTILGHLDLVKKFGHRPTDLLQDAVDVLARRLAAAGVVVELNTAGLRKPVREIYPSAHVLRSLRSAGVPITFGSDAHAPAEVGHDLDRAATLARECGYDRYAALRADESGAQAARELRALPPAPRK